MGRCQQTSAKERTNNLRSYETNPSHTSLHFKKLTERNGREIRSARVTLKYRALAAKLGNDYVWFWIGEHGTYDDIT